MIKKRGRFLTLVFSMVPGMGHMWNGFMKRGISFMGLFFAMWFFASWLNIWPISIMMPVVWFYAFFDCINIRFQDDQDFYALHDDYLFSVGDVMNLTMSNRRVKLIVGVTLIAVGLCVLWQNVLLPVLYQLGLTEEMWRVIHGIGTVVPRIIVALIIIWFGFSLIRGNHRGEKYAINDQEKAQAKDVEYTQVDEHERA